MPCSLLGWVRIRVITAPAGAALVGVVPAVASSAFAAAGAPGPGVRHVVSAG